MLLHQSSCIGRVINHVNLGCPRAHLMYARPALASMQHSRCTSPGRRSHSHSWTRERYSLPGLQSGLQFGRARHHACIGALLLAALAKTGQRIGKLYKRSTAVLGPEAEPHHECHTT